MERFRRRRRVLEKEQRDEPETDKALLFLLLSQLDDVLHHATDSYLQVQEDEEEIERLLLPDRRQLEEVLGEDRRVELDQADADLLQEPVPDVEEDELWDVVERRDWYRVRGAGTSQRLEEQLRLLRGAVALPRAHTRRHEDVHALELGELRVRRVLEVEHREDGPEEAMSLEECVEEQFLDRVVVPVVPDDAEAVRNSAPAVEVEGQLNHLEREVLLDPRMRITGDRVDERERENCVRNRSPGCDERHQRRDVLKELRVALVISRPLEEREFESADALQAIRQAERTDLWGPLERDEALREEHAAWERWCGEEVVRWRAYTDVAQFYAVQLLQFVIDDLHVYLLGFLTLLAFRPLALFLGKLFLSRGLEEPLCELLRIDFRQVDAAVPVEQRSLRVAHDLVALLVCDVHLVLVEELSHSVRYHVLHVYLFQYELLCVVNDLIDAEVVVADVELLLRELERGDVVDNLLLALQVVYWLLEELRRHLLRYRLELHQRVDEVERVAREELAELLHGVKQEADVPDIYLFDVASLDLCAEEECGAARRQHVLVRCARVRWDLRLNLRQLQVEVRDDAVPERAVVLLDRQAREETELLQDDVDNVLDEDDRVLLHVRFEEWEEPEERLDEDGREAEYRYRLNDERDDVDEGAHPAAMQVEEDVAEEREAVLEVFEVEDVQTPDVVIDEDLELLERHRRPDGEDHLFRGLLELLSLRHCRVLDDVERALYHVLLHQCEVEVWNELQRPEHVDPVRQLDQEHLQEELKDEALRGEFNEHRLTKKPYPGDYHAQLRSPRPMRTCAGSWAIIML